MGLVDGDELGPEAEADDGDADLLVGCHGNLPWERTGVVLAEMNHMDGKQARKKYTIAHQPGARVLKLRFLESLARNPYKTRRFRGTKHLTGCQKDAPQVLDPLGFEEKAKLQKA